MEYNDNFDRFKLNGIEINLKYKSNLNLNLNFPIH